MMAIKTQGTHLYFIDPSDDSVVNVGCTTSVSGIDSGVSQIETTCLQDDARTYVAGLLEPTTTTFELNVDTASAAHVLLHQLKTNGTVLQWALGWADGTAAPTVNSGGDFVLPATRSWLTFDGYVANFPFDFALNGIVKSTVGVQISGDPVLTAKSA